MIIKEISTASIIPYEHNPRQNKDAVECVAKSIKEFGFRQPIVVDENNVIVIGHTRWKAAQKLGLESVPVHIADGLSPEKIKALRLVDNKSNELAEWNYDKLIEEIQAIPEINLESMGFADIEELNLMDKLENLDKPEKKDIMPYNKMHILLSFHPDELKNIEPQLASIKENSNVEYRQSAN